MRRERDWEYVKKKDLEFWESVHYLVPILLRSMATPMVHRLYIRPTDGDARLISHPVQVLPMVTPLYTFFSRSPDCFIPLKNYVCQIQGTNRPIAFSKTELLVFLWRCSKDALNLSQNYVTSLCRQLDPIFLQGDGIYWNVYELEEPRDLDVLQAKVQLERVYRLWVQYIKRHYDRTLLGRNDKERLFAKIMCVDAIRSHFTPNIMLPSAGDMCTALTLVDDTLCFTDGPSSSLRNYPGPVMDNELLDCLMQYGMFPKNTKSDIIKILQLHQKILIQERKENDKSEQISCFNYWDNSAEYAVFYDKKSGKYSYKAHNLTTTRGRKRMLLQQCENAEPPREYLYELLDGSQEGLCELAKLSACCFCGENIFKGAIVVPKEQVGTLFAFLSLICGYDIQNMSSGKDMVTLSKKSTMDWLIKMKLDGQPFALSFDSGKRLSDKQWMCLKKILSGVHITYKDSILGRKMHTSIAQWLVVGDDQTVQKLRGHGIKVMQLTFPLKSAFPRFKTSSWLQQIFPLWGYLQLLTKKEKKQKSDYNSIQFFMNNCCQITEEEVEFIPARTLYNIYAAFCKSQGRNDILKFKDFNDVLEEDYGLKRSRHHSADGKNPTGFKHIHIELTDRDQHQAPKEQEPLSSEEVFFQKLDQMEQEVHARFDHYPF